MKYIIVTGNIVGKTIQYEHIGHKGQRRMVPVYQTEICDDSRPDLNYKFAVTRDSALVVFGKIVRRYTKGGECPPNRNCAPYRVRVRIARRNGWCLALYEQGFIRPDGSPDWSTLQGQGKIKRHHTLIHAGPASGLGCMSVAGGKVGFAKFRKAAEQLLGSDEEIVVYVEPRPQAHHDIHLSRSRG